MSIDRLTDQIERALADLMRNGYCVIRAAAPAHDIADIESDLTQAFETAPYCVGGFYGERTKRFGRLLVRSAHTERFVLHTAIMTIVDRVLGASCDSVQLNLTQGVAIHPGELAQFPHRDQDMWPCEGRRPEFLVNVMWPFTPYTRENGATLVWPGSHGSAALDPPPEDGGTPVEMEPGDALVFLGSTLHAAGANRTAMARRGMIVGYCLGWLKPYENQWLAYPPAIARRFSPQIAGLVGYRQHRPNLGNYEGLCPSVLLDPDPRDFPGATDAMLPFQTEAIAAFANQQRGSG